MIQVKEVTDQYKGDYEHYINRVIREQTEAGWKFIDIKHSVAANSSGKVFFSVAYIRRLSDLGYSNFIKPVIENGSNNTKIQAAHQGFREILSFGFGKRNQ